MALRLGKVGVIFDSGAFYGAFGMGAAKAIWERGIKPIALGGVSVGALNAAKITENNSLKGVKELEKVWLEIEQTGPSAVFSTWEAVKQWIRRDRISLYDSARLISLVEKIDPK